MPLDPIAAGLLQQMDEAGMPPLNEMSPADARVAAEGFHDLAGEPEDVADVSDRTIPVPAGRSRSASTRRRGSARCRCLVYYHGGGWVLGDIEGPTPSAARWPTRPAAWSCRSTTGWRRSTSSRCRSTTATPPWSGWPPTPASIGVDTERLAVGGDSAGGNLAAAVALRARDAGGPALRLQLLVYPVTNHDFGTVSYTDNGDGYLLTLDMMKWFWDHYLGVGRRQRERRWSARCWPTTSPVCHGPSCSRPSSIRCATRARPTPRGCGKPGSPSSTSATTARSTRSSRCLAYSRRRARRSTTRRRAARGVRMTPAQRHRRRRHVGVAAIDDRLHPVVDPFEDLGLGGQDVEPVVTDAVDDLVGDDLGTPAGAQCVLEHRDELLDLGSRGGHVRA